MKSPTQSPIEQRYPTKSPSQSPIKQRDSDPLLVPQCNWDQSLLEVSINADHKPEEISWALVRNGVKVADGFGNSNQANRITRYYECVPAGFCYQFHIKDTGGNGIQNGGWFTVKDGDDVIVDKQSFTSNSQEIPVALEGGLRHYIGQETNSGKTKETCKWLKDQSQKKRESECFKPYIQEKCGHACQTCTANVQSNIIEPIPECEWDQSLVEIQVKTDNKPEQISWKLHDSRGNVINSFSNYIESNTVVKNYKCILAANCYTLRLQDDGGDGIQNGYIKVIEAGQVVVEDNSFTSSEVNYAVPVEGNRKYDIGWPGQNNLKCNWLDTRPWKRNEECKKHYIRTHCVRVCATCNVK